MKIVLYVLKVLFFFYFWFHLAVLGSFWVVFRQKNNRLTAQSVIVNR